MTKELNQIKNTTGDKDMALIAQSMEFLAKELEEFKKETSSNFDEVKKNTSGNYAAKSVAVDHEKRIARLEKAALAVLGTTFSLVFVAVIGLVIMRNP